MQKMFCYFVCMLADKFAYCCLFGRQQQDMHKPTRPQGLTLQHGLAETSVLIV
jgi:hypothetical protein